MWQKNGLNGRAEAKSHEIIQELRKNMFSNYYLLCHKDTGRPETPQSFAVFHFENPGIFFYQYDTCFPSSSQSTN